MDIFIYVFILIMADRPDSATCSLLAVLGVET